MATPIMGELETDAQTRRKRRARLKVLGAVASATVFILPFKIATEGGRGAGAALGLLACTALIFFPRMALRYGSLTPKIKRNSRSLAWKLAFFASAGNVAQGYALGDLHAGVAATIVQMNVLFVGVIGAVWLKERLDLGYIVGLTLVVSGLVVAQLQSGVQQFSWSTGVLWAVGAALGFSMMDLVSRRESHGVDPVQTNVERAFMGAVLLLFVPGAIEQLLSMSRVQWAACAFSALMGPGLARELLIRASKDLPALESALLQQIRPIFVLPLTSLVFGTWPTTHQWLACLLMTLGISTPFVLARYRRALEN